MSDNNVVSMPSTRAVVEAQPADMPEPKEWLTLDEAAAYMEKSIRHVQRLAQARIVPTRMVSRPGKPSQKMYHYPDLQRVKTEGKAAPVLHRMPEPVAVATSPAGAEALHSLNDPNPTVMPWNHLIPEIHKHWTMAEQAAQHEREQATSGHVWLTIDEAHAYTHASKARLLRAAQAGVLVAIKDGEWKVKRSSLDAWDGTTGEVRPVKKAATKARKRH